MITLPIHRLISAISWNLAVKRGKILAQKVDVGAALFAQMEESDRYDLFCYYYHHLVPPAVRAHREYFSKNLRGFGERAFHAMWWNLFNTYSIKKCIEIGVYRGQVCSLWGLLALLEERPIDILCISPFSSSADSVSEYISNIDYHTDVLANFTYFNLPKPRTIRSLSTAPMAIEAIRSTKDLDLAYIDGSHEYDVVKADVSNIWAALRSNGILVIDDSALLNEKYRPRKFAFKGHPGPSRVASELLLAGAKRIANVGHNTIFQKTDMPIKGFDV